VVRVCRGVEEREERGATATRRLCVCESSEQQGRSAARRMNLHTFLGDDEPHPITQSDLLATTDPRLDCKAADHHGAARRDRGRGEEGGEGDNRRRRRAAQRRAQSRLRRHARDDLPDHVDAGRQAPMREVRLFAFAFASAPPPVVADVRRSLSRSARPTKTPPAPKNRRSRPLPAPARPTPPLPPYTQHKPQTHNTQHTKHKKTASARASPSRRGPSR
jgi:hypothetical protein